MSKCGAQKWQITVFVFSPFVQYNRTNMRRERERVKQNLLFVYLKLYLNERQRQQQQERNHKIVPKRAYKKFIGFVMLFDQKAHSYIHTPARTHTRTSLYTLLHSAHHHTTTHKYCIKYNTNLDFLCTHIRAEAATIVDAHKRTRTKKKRFGVREGERERSGYHL